jgi:hypothetical protein
VINSETDWPEQIAHIRSKHRYRTEKIDGVEVERNLDNGHSLIGAPVVVIWSAAQVTMEMNRRHAGAELDRIPNLAERIVRLCSPGNDMKILLENQAVVQKLEQMREASHHGFEGISPEE